MSGFPGHSFCGPLLTIYTCVCACSLCVYEDQPCANLLGSERTPSSKVLSAFCPTFVFLFILLCGTRLLENSHLETCIDTRGPGTHPRSHTLPGINFTLYNGFKKVYTESGWHHVTPLTAFSGPLSSWSPQTVGGSWSDFPVQQDSPYGRTF